MKISREFIFTLVFNTLRNVTSDKSNTFPKGFRIWLGREKRKKEKTEEITNLIRKKRASKSRGKVITIIDAKLKQFYLEYKTNAKKTK